MNALRVRGVPGLRRAFAGLSVALFLLGAGGCAKKPQPSPQFAEGRAKFNTLYSAQLDEAFGTPQMDEVVSLLESVPAESSDSPAAKELLERIEQEGKRVEIERQVREQMTEASLEQAPPPRAERAAPEAEPVSAPAVAAPPPDAGSDPVPYPTVGMGVVEFEKRFGVCFKMGEMIVIEGEGPSDSRVLKDMSMCREKLPGFEERLVLVRNGKIAAVVDRSSVRTTQLDGGR